MRTLAAFLILTLVACGGGKERSEEPPENAPGKRLTRAEVAAELIGKPWRGSAGVYLFRRNGTYSYTSLTTTLAFRRLPYRLDPEGVIRTSATNLTFYRIGTAIRYYNSSSREFFLVRPAK